MYGNSQNLTRNLLRGRAPRVLTIGANCLSTKHRFLNACLGGIVTDIGSAPIPQVYETCDLSNLVLPVNFLKKERFYKSLAPPNALKSRPLLD